MYSFASKKTHESTSCPGVKFTVRVLNEIQRARRDLALIDTRARINELRDKWSGLMPAPKPGAKPEDAPDDLGPHALEIVRLSEEAGMIERSVLLPAYIRASLISIEGLEIDGAAATVDTLIESGRDALLGEIYQACAEAAGLGADETKNSPSPGTSPEAEAGQESSTTAAAAAR